MAEAEGVAELKRSVIVGGPDRPNGLTRLDRLRHIQEAPPRLVWVRVWAQTRWILRVDQGW